MDTTSPSLLIRVRQSEDSEAWSRFVDLYTPLIFYWARKIGLDTADASDLVQEVLTLLIKKLPLFDYESKKSFRGWLRTVTLNRWRELNRRKQISMVDATASVLDEIPEPDESIQFWERDYRKQLVARAMQLARPQFEPKTWNALREYVLSPKGANEIAKDHGLSVWTIYAAKTRLLAKLRDELDGMLD